MNIWFKVFFLIFLPFVIYSQVPDRVILNLTSEPSSSIAITWRMEKQVKNAIVQYAESTDWTQFKNQLVSVSGKEEKVEISNQKSEFHYSTILKNLKSSTRYVYRVGCDSMWSEWNQFSTASNSIRPFSFVWFGDPQDSILEQCSRVFRQAFATASYADFWLFSGDITSEPEDKQLGDFFSAAGFIFRTVPSVLVPGNHDLGYKIENGQIVRNKKGKKERIKTVSKLWNAHYTLPENGIPRYEETSYYFDYQGVRFILLNSNDRLEEQAKWLEPLLSKNPNIWTIISFHHPFYSSGRERDDKETRNAFQTLFDKYDVDLVLTGHDHTYSRSKKIKNGFVVSDSLKGTVYVVSVSGPKQYSVNSGYKELMEKLSGDVQLFQVVSVDGKILNYRSFIATGELFDSFTLKK